MNNQKDMKDLVDKLNVYRDSYYNKNTSLVSDKQYDELFDRLVKMEEETGIVYANSPTVTVGYDAVSKLQKVRHNHPLLSLGKTTDMNEFRDYFGNHDICLMAKMDGVTASIKYADGELVSAESRGNGEVGEDITHNARVFANLPKHIPVMGEFIVDGECIIDYGTFKKINEREHTEYKHPRNLVSGTVRQLDSKIAASRNVKFIAWKLFKYEAENKISVLRTQSGRLEYLRGLGFDVAPFCVYNGDPKSRHLTTPIRGVCDRMGYPIDGLVGTFEDVEYGESLGCTAHHPKHSLAFKFYQEDNETTLRDIEWNVSRTGLVNPVAIVDPVEIDGTTVSRASLCNLSVIKELEIGIGDKLTIIKANQIIPKITANLTKSNTYEFPKVCPCCGHKLVVRNDAGREMLYCTNDHCPAILKDKLVNFVSREGMNINGLSTERLAILMDRGFITDFYSIYTLKDKAEKLMELDGFGKSSVESLIQAIEDSKKCKFANLLVAIGIPGIGKSSSKSLSKFCKLKHNGISIFDTFIDLASANFDWSVIEDFGELTSSAINEFVRSNFAAINPLLGLFEFEEDSADNIFSDVLGGKTFCITGKLVKYARRAEMVEDIETHGGNVVAGVSARTDYLVNNDSESQSSKNQKAKKLGVKIITEEELIEMMEEDNG